MRPYLLRILSNHEDKLEIVHAESDVKELIDISPGGERQGQ